MFSIPHMIVVFVIVLVVFGPQKLPELARGLGKLMAEFRKASTDFKSAFENEMRDLERQAQEVERKKRELLASVAALPQPATLATPSGAETQPGAPELATGGPEPDKGATEAPLITPVAQSVARGSESPELSAETTVAGATEATVEAQSESHSVEPKADDGSDALAAPHDHKQPA
jgi:sec-independent protein translocase protein TatB